MSLPILFFITLIAVVILTLMLVEKNNNMTRLENEAESLKKHLCDLEIQKSKFLKELKKDKDKLQEELCVVKKELEALNDNVAQLKKYKTESQKERNLNSATL